MTDYDSPVQLSDGEHEPFIRRAAEEYPALSFVNILLRLLDAARATLAERDRQLDAAKRERDNILDGELAPALSSLDEAATRVAVLEQQIAEMRVLRQRVAVLEAALHGIKEYWNRNQNERAMLDALQIMIGMAEVALAAPAAPREEGTP